VGAVFLSCHLFSGNADLEKEKGKGERKKEKDAARSSGEEKRKEAGDIKCLLLLPFIQQRLSETSRGGGKKRKEKRKRRLARAGCRA